MMTAFLKSVLYKSAAAGKDPGAAAMAGAAAVAKPSFAPAMPDFTKKKDEKDGENPDLSKDLENKDKEIERLKNEKRIVEQNLQFEQLKSRENEASRKLEQQERAGLERIRQEQQKLDQKKILAQADEVRHKSMLAKQESDSQLKIQQDKNKSIMDLHNQQLKMQMSQADKSLQMQMQAADKARATADKYKDDARKQIDKERAEMQKAYDAKHSGMSPALNHSMTGAIKALGQFGKPQKVKIPKPGTSPESMMLVNPKSRLGAVQQQEDPTEIKAASINLQERMRNRIGYIPNTIEKVAINLFGNQEKDPGDKSPWKNSFFGQSALASGVLGTMFGSPFAFNKNVDAGNITSNNDPVANRSNIMHHYQYNPDVTLARSYGGAARINTPGIAGRKQNVNMTRNYAGYNGYGNQF